MFIMRFHFGNDQLKMLQCNTFQLTNHNTSHQTTLIRNPSSYRLFLFLMSQLNWNSCTLLWPGELDPPHSKPDYPIETSRKGTGSDKVDRRYGPFSLRDTFVMTKPLFGLNCGI